MDWEPHRLIPPSSQIEKTHTKYHTSITLFEVLCEVFMYTQVRFMYIQKNLCLQALLRQTCHCCPAAAFSVRSLSTTVVEPSWSASAGSRSYVARSSLQPSRLKQLVYRANTAAVLCSVIEQEMRIEFLPKVNTKLFASAVLYCSKCACKYEVF